jgi:hypothetical protein
VFNRGVQATNRLGEAEPFMRRALTIDENSFGLDHPRSNSVRSERDARCRPVGDRIGRAVASRLRIGSISSRPSGTLGMDRVMSQHGNLKAVCLPGCPSNA